MKRFIPYILVSVLALAIILLYVSGKRAQKKVFDDRISLKRQDKIPYATFVAFEQLPQLFPEAKIRISRKEPGFWDSVSLYDNRQAFICITDRFGADETEMGKLLDFARSGNDVFISACLIFLSGMVMPTKKSYSGVSHLKRNADTYFGSSIKLMISDYAPPWGLPPF